MARHSQRVNFMRIVSFGLVVTTLACWMVDSALALDNGIAKNKNSTVGASLLSSRQDESELTVGDKKHSTLAKKGVDEYSINAKENSFLLGVVEQISVDVIVTVFDGDGKKLAEFDGPGRGAERFQFETKQAGVYKIKVAAFEEETGEYEVTLTRIEPVATDPADRVDQLMAPYDNPKTPGGVVAVIQGGKITFARGYGASNLTHGVPFEIDTRTNIGSTSKQFTAYAILLLAKQNKLALDDDIRKHIPELPELGEVVTLRHALTHTSGYREFLNTISMTGRRLDRGDWIDRTELIEIVQRQPKLQNSPGTEFNYNNTGFGLLATVVERIGEKPFHVWMKENLFAPLGMSDTFVRANPLTIIERSSQGYTPADEGGYRDSPDLGGAVGAGGIYTTVGDLAKWVRNFETGELGGKEIFQQMSTPYKLTSGKSTKYGFGLFIDQFKGQPRVHHGGADTAHRSMLMYFPELDVAVVTQSNNSGFSSKTADAIAQLFFADKFDDDSKESAKDTKTDAFDPKSFDASTFDKMAGKFELDEMPGFVLSLTREGDKFHTQATGQPKLQIVPTGPTSFELVGVEAALTFEKNEDGEFETLTLHQNGDHTAKRLKDKPWSPDKEQLTSYSGTFFSNELETFYRFDIIDDSLVLKQRRQVEPIELTSVKEHQFVATKLNGTKFKFQADSDGKIMNIIVDNGRTRDVQFKRIKLD